MKGLNIHKLVSTSLQCVTPMMDIIIKLFDGQIKDDNADWIVSYSDYAAIARIQLANKQELKHIESVNATTVARRFYITVNQLSGLNRNIGTGGDYIYYDGMYYKIVEVVYDFKVQWYCVVGIQTANLGD